MRVAVSLLLASMVGSSYAGDDCLLDQNTRHKDNLALQKRYPGSQYIGAQYTVIIPVEEGTVSISKGGCGHYGMDIELRTSKTKAFQNENTLFSKILELAKAYAPDMLDIDRLEKALHGKQWQNIGDEYFLDYEGYAAFHIGTRDDEAFTHIGMTFYN